MALFDFLKKKKAKDEACCCTPEPEAKACGCDAEPACCCAPAEESCCCAEEKSDCGCGCDAEPAKEDCCCAPAEESCCCAEEAKEDACCCAPAEESCCCGCSECAIKSIKVLGLGCKNCHEMNQATIAAVKELGMDLEVEYITDMEKISAYGVMSMPGLVVNETVVSQGKVLKTADVIELLKKLGYC